jgi:hypothetical protein
VVSRRSQRCIEVVSVKKTGRDGKVHFTIRFYDKFEKELFRISLIHSHPGIMIDGVAYEPTPEIVQSLKYLMPHIAYEEISNSVVYNKYFDDASSEDIEASNQIEKVER